MANALLSLKPQGLVPCQGMLLTCVYEPGFNKTLGIVLEHRSALH